MTTNGNKVTVQSVDLTNKAVIVTAKNEKTSWTSTYPLSKSGMKSRKDIGMFIKEQDMQNFYRADNGVKAVLLEAGALDSAFSNEQLARQAVQAKADAKRLSFINKIKGA